MKGFLKRTICSSIALFSSSYIFAVDVNTADYTALPENTNLFLVYLQYNNADKYYTKGTVVDNSTLKSNIGVFRFIHFLKFGNITLDPQFLLPFGRIYDSKVADNSLNDASGVGDPLIGATFWLINQPNKGVSGRYLGITPLITLPWGDYNKNDILNIGENRFKYNLQLGWVEPLYKNLSFELMQDIVWYGDNNLESGGKKLSQNETYQTQLNFRYDINSEQRLALGYSIKTGGKQFVNNFYSGIDTNSQQLRLEYQKMISPKIQLSGQFIKDTEINNGFKNDYGLNIRALYVF
ncbi:transporter [Acinetobacter pittii]|uniref:transporter n=1 Tax=Acinetobacter pittii TaxID=48296 RepID=UPI003A849917